MPVWSLQPQEPCYPAKQLLVLHAGVAAADQAEAQAWQLCKLCTLCQAMAF